MKTILEKFPKAVLIDFICDQTILYRFKTKDHLEGKLLYFQWEQEESACERKNAEIMAEMERFKDWDITGNHYRYMEALKKSQLNHKRWEQAQKIYEKAQKLRGY